MQETKNYIEKLFLGNKITVESKRNKMFNDFAAEELNIDAVKQIQALQNNIMSSWELKTKIINIIEQSVKIPNATVGKIYEAKIDFEKLGWNNDIVFSDFEDLEKYGLVYNNETEIISGTPTLSGDFKINFTFRVEGEQENSPLNKKQISLVINADPKSLWKNIPSDTKDIYWKEDTAQDFQPIGDKHIVVSSKRGRSHANVGSFRDDDYAFKHFENTGWSVVVVSDGAGSAKASRKGSAIACKEIVNYFETHLTVELSNEFDGLMKTHQEEINIKKNDINVEIIEPVTDDASLSVSVTGEMIENVTVAKESIEPEKVESNSSKINKFIYNTLGNAANNAHKVLDEFATKNEIGIKDLHSTLIFALFKKYEFGYVVLSFSVGDCPIAILNKDMSDFKLMNWLDVGEYGGGTRFITMPEIFVSEKFPTRFGFKLIDDFSYLILMTDGIYDPKFVVEANLEKLEKWKEFLLDLGGNNEDNTKVKLQKENTEIANQLNVWMDFWSPGNHDDRTLAIVF